MKAISISKESKLYRFFNFLAFSEYYSFIHIDYRTGSVNSFNDVCTFISHSIKILLWSAFYCLAILTLLLVVFGLIFLVGMSVYEGIIGPIQGNFTYHTSCIVVYPLIFWIITNRVHKFEVYSDDHEESMFGKFKEIVSARSNNLCVKIDVIESKSDSFKKE